MVFVSCIQIQYRGLRDIDFFVHTLHIHVSLELYSVLITLIVKCHHIKVILFFIFYFVRLLLGQKEAQVVPQSLIGKEELLL